MRGMADAHAPQAPMATRSTSVLEGTAHQAAEPPSGSGGSRCAAVPTAACSAASAPGLAEHLRRRPGVSRLVVAVLVARRRRRRGSLRARLGADPGRAGERGHAATRGAWREAVLIVLVGRRAAGSACDGRAWLSGDDAHLAAGRSEPAGWRSSGVRRRRPAAATGRCRRLSPRELLRRPAQVDVPRVVLGALLVAFASAALLHRFGVLHSLGKAIGAVAIVATMLGSAGRPWVVRLGRSLASERAARIREQERAEVAAHLHDSVLQTLALIQKRAGDPREVAGLARRQERELRHWLQERPSRASRDSVAGALERAAAEVEELHRVPIEVVTVGDGPLERRARGAGPGRARGDDQRRQVRRQRARRPLRRGRASERVEVFVRDRGVGFDPTAIPPTDAACATRSSARMERHQRSRGGAQRRRARAPRSSWSWSAAGVSERPSRAGGDRRRPPPVPRGRARRARRRGRRSSATPAASRGAVAGDRARGARRGAARRAHARRRRRRGDQARARRASGGALPRAVGLRRRRGRDRA